MQTTYPCLSFIFTTMKGTVNWIGIRPERKAPVQVVEYVFADIENGLTGDHPAKAHRQVTLISNEALKQVADLLGKPSVDPADTRRNILISGLDFGLASGRQLQVGEALLEVTGPCLPCSRMEENLGEGGRLAMANTEAGGLTAKILQSGKIAVGDTVSIMGDEAAQVDGVAERSR
jgi:MOSC domain-containing protein YiiM